MRHNRFFLLLPILALAAFLSACAGGAQTANSWPGLSVDGDTAYIAFNRSVYAVNLDDGTQRWVYPGPDQTVEGNPSFFAPPAVSSDGRLVVGDYLKKLRLLDAENGSETIGGAWPFTGATNLYVGSPLTVGSEIYAPNSDGSLYALSVSGDPLWNSQTFNTDQGLWVKPATDGEFLFVPSQDHNLYALDIATGSQVWMIDLGGASLGTPALSEDGRLYIGSLNKEMLALDSRTGDPIWEFPTLEIIWAGPVLADGVLYFGDMSGNFYAVDAETGTQLWNASLGSPILSSPLAVDDRIYVTTEGGTLFIYSTDGSRVREVPVTGAHLYSSPVQADDLILVSPMDIDALLLAFSLEGDQQWTFTPTQER
jgi:outer membrane protein assembly factor BamB